MMEGVELTEEAGPQGNDKAMDDVAAEPTTTSRRDNADEKEEETAWEQEDEDDWTRKAEEAKKTAKAKANKSPLAKRWDKKNPAGLQAFGFVGPKTRYVPAEKADSSSNAAQSEQPLLRGQLPFQMYC